MEEAIKYFAVFGGLDIKIDTSKPLLELIEEHILRDYKYLRNVISDLTSGDRVYHSILTGLAMGDRRTNSAFRRAKVSFNHGSKCIEEMVEMGVIDKELSLQHLTNSPRSLKVSDKLLFREPFVRFWFAFISPIFKGIKEGTFEEFLKRFQSREAEFTDMIFEQLSHEFLKKAFSPDTITQLGRYWDDENEINLLGKTHQGKIIAGSCKYSNSKVKKSELAALKQKCEELEIPADIFVLFSKKGYTNELKALKSENIKLYTAKSFKLLLDK